MKTAIQNNKSVIKFLATFIISYAVLYFIYYCFLNSSNNIDFFTKTVSNQTVKLLNFLGYETLTTTNTTNDFILLLVRGKNIANIAEGCNAVSVMILFVAFIFSFYKDLKSTVLYCILGVIIIHVINIIRIVIIVICMYHFPEYANPLHDFVFPAMIYSVVFLLWVFWVKSFQKSKNESKG